MLYDSDEGATITLLDLSSASLVVVEEVVTSFAQYTVTRRDPEKYVRVLHSENDVPSMVRPSGYQAWHKFGFLHRDGAPAVVMANGKQRYYQKGELHREDGPAVICPDGAVAYLQRGKLHRADGPAIVCHSGLCVWFWKGRRMSRAEHEAKRLKSK